MATQVGPRPGGSLGAPWTNEEHKTNVNAVDPLPNKPSDNIIEEPKFPAYIDLRDRRETYTNWAQGMKQTSDACAEAGFFYVGSGDKVVCFHCGIGLKDWADTDIPWEEHVHWSPKCQHILNKKGREYIENVQECKRTCQKDGPIAVLTCHHAKYIIRQETQKRPNILNAEAGSESSSTQGNRKLCMKCEKRLSDVVFLPCGHVNTCFTCSPLVPTCPTCHKTRNGVIRMYFS